MEYDEHGVKKVFKTKYSRYKECYVVGQRRKMLGTYCKGSRGYSFDGPAYDEPPSLDVTGSVLLWEVREELKSAPFLVSDEDIISDE